MIQLSYKILRMGLSFDQGKNGSITANISTNGTCDGMPGSFRFSEYDG
jgi:hypothetical protein